MSTELEFEQRAAIGIVRLARPAKRNALSDSLIAEIKHCFETLPSSVKVVVLDAAGDNFCAGLDLGELRERDVVEGLQHSQSWHTAFGLINMGRVPVIAALKGAVIGGGLELACSAHIRVADDSTYYALPEGTRGIFVGGGGSVRISNVVGVPRMMDMMLTGRVLNADEGDVYGLAQYRTPAGASFERALALAAKIANNAPLSNYAILHALPRIARQTIEDGLMTESLISAIAQSAPEAKARVKDFLDNKQNKVKRED